MVDEATKKTLAAIPLCKVRAGPRDGEWPSRLKEEYVSLIKASVSKSIQALLKILKLGPCIYMHLHDVYCEPIVKP